MELPLAIAYICDDIRLEINGKPFIIGLYPNNMTFESLPAVLPQIAVWVTIISDIKTPLKKFTVSVTFPGNKEISADYDMPDTAITNSFPDATRFEASVTVPVRPFVVSEPGILTVLVKYDGGVLLARRLPLEVFSPPTPEANPSNQYPAGDLGNN